LPVDYATLTSGTTNGVPHTTPYSSYYYNVSAETRYSGVTRGRNTTPPPPSGVDPVTHVALNLNFYIATDPILDRIRKPGNTAGPTQQYTCNGGGMGASGPASSPDGSGGGGTPLGGYEYLLKFLHNYATGNVHFIVNDPVPTRGYPLRN